MAASTAVFLFDGRLCKNVSVFVKLSGGCVDRGPQFSTASAATRLRSASKNLESRTELNLKTYSALAKQ